MRNNIQNMKVLQYQKFIEKIEIYNYELWGLHALFRPILSFVPFYIESSFPFFSFGLRRNTQTT